MDFKKTNLTSVDFNKLTEGDVANATLKSFSYRSGYCFGQFVADDETVTAIIGKQEDYKIGDLLPLKGIEVEIEYRGTKVSNGVTYPRYSVQF